MSIDAAGNKLALEVRDGDTLLAYFYTYDPLTDEVKQLPLAPERSWWLGMETIHEGIVFLHGYGDRKLGQHRGIKAFAVDNHELLWEQPELSYYGISAKGILAFDAAAPENGFIVLHATNGSVLSEVISQQAAAELVQQYSLKRDAACIFPAHYLQGEPYFEDVRQFIAQISGKEPVLALDYAELNNYIVISYYLQGAEGKLINLLNVYGTDGNLLLKKCLGEGLTGLGKDTFIIFNQNLYMIQHKQILRVYKLH